MEADELASRQEELWALGETLTEAQLWVKVVLQDVGWTQEHLLQKDEDLVACPNDGGHRVPATSLERHTQDCSLYKQGYSRQEVMEMKEANHFYDKATLVEPIPIDDEMFARILESVREYGLQGQSSRRHRPLTVDRAAVDLTRAERLAIYQHCVDTARAATKPTSIPTEGLTLLKEDKVEEKPGMTLMERRALERDMRRRRQTYRGKSTHTTKKTHLEVLRDVIDNQMDLLTRMYQGGKVKVTDSEVTQGSRSKPDDREDRREDRREGRRGDRREDRREDRRDDRREDRREDRRPHYATSRRSGSPTSDHSQRLRSSSRDREHLPALDRIKKEDDSGSEKKHHKHKKHKKHKHKKERKRSRSRSRERSRERSQERSRDNLRSPEKSVAGEELKQ